MKRRQMGVVMLSMAVSILLTLNLSCGTGPMKLDKVGLQLWSVRGEMQKDFEGTMKKIADAGYDQVEFAGYYDKSPEEIRDLLKTLGLTAPAAHVGYNQLSGDELQKTIEAAKIIGLKYLIMPSLPPVRPPAPRPPQGERRERKPYTMDEVKKMAAIFNEIGKACHDAGLGFAYHNHKMEFVMVDDTEMMYDILLKETDPDLVDFEMDLGWAVAAGADPIEYFNKYPGRFTFFHVKDMNKENHSVVVGDGAIDFASIFAQSELAGVKYYIVEYEGSADPIESVAASVKYLKNMTF